MPKNSCPFYYTIAILKSKTSWSYSDYQWRVFLQLKPRIGTKFMSLFFLMTNHLLIKETTLVFIVVLFRQRGLRPAGVQDGNPHRERSPSHHRACHRHCGCPRSKHDLQDKNEWGILNNLYDDILGNGHLFRRWPMKITALRINRP